MDDGTKCRRSLLVSRFSKLNKKIQLLAVSSHAVRQLSSIRQLRRKQPILPWRRIFIVTGAILFVMISIWCFIARFHWPISRKTLFEYSSVVVQSNIKVDKCLIGINTHLLSSVRPVINCDMCRGMTQIDKVKNISADELMSKYVNPIRPVLIEGSINLNATGVTFDFDFFKRLYKTSKHTFKNKHPSCEFERFLTTSGTVEELLNMSDEEANSPGGDDPLSWYVGWANCDRSVTEVLSGYFRPTFFPNTTELSNKYWIYMGSPNHGFSMHIDPRFDPQWQTQVHGRKKFTFLPPDECYFACNYQPMEVIMNPGDTLIFHAGMWYHETKNIGDSIIAALGTSFR